MALLLTIDDSDEIPLRGGGGASRTRSGVPCRSNLGLDEIVVHLEIDVC